MRFKVLDIFLLALLLVCSIACLPMDLGVDETLLKISAQILKAEASTPASRRPVLGFAETPYGQQFTAWRMTEEEREMATFKDELKSLGEEEKSILIQAVKNNAGRGIPFEFGGSKRERKLSESKEIQAELPDAAHFPNEARNYFKERPLIKMVLNGQIYLQGTSRSRTWGASSQAPAVLVWQHILPDQYVLRHRYKVDGTVATKLTEFWKENGMRNPVSRPIPRRS